MVSFRIDNRGTSTNFTFSIFCSVTLSRPFVVKVSAANRSHRKQKVPRCTVDSMSIRINKLVNVELEIGEEGRDIAASLCPLYFVQSR